jgi:hypothetical protein
LLGHDLNLIEPDAHGRFGFEDTTKNNGRFCFRWKDMKAVGPILPA